MVEKYGFVYIWFDRKHKKYYIGCHWGFENDGYICSSKWMREARKRRPNDFKRRIVARVYTTRQDLLEVENRYLSLIKDEELGKKYYNLTKHMNGHWSTNEQTKLTVGQKISASPNRNANISKANKGKSISDEQKEKARVNAIKQFENPEQREIKSKRLKELWNDPEYRQKQSDKHKVPRPHMKGRTVSDETREKMRNSRLRFIAIQSSL